ncbi:Calmodulin [Rhynchospora pubera]|uniref:Calmodulin n=2 Tax=Rhynchospora pubera TaxID=906938 RepID=A0AAV8E8G4_9POAL|nr:Calmodulin [Rhynchospora pubera]
MDVNLCYNYARSENPKIRKRKGKKKSQKRRKANQTIHQKYSSTLPEQSKRQTRSRSILQREKSENKKEKREENFEREREMGKAELSEEQVASMREAFSLFDTDGDGRIAPSDLGVLMRSLGGNPTQAQLKEITTSEKLTTPFDFNRFLDLMRTHLRPEPFDRPLRDAFKVLDKDGTGVVHVSDLRHVLTSIGEKLEPAEFDEWIREVDVGPDGAIRYEDFIQRLLAK